MNTLYWLITITDRHSTDAFLALYEEHGITVSLRTVGAGTAVRETLSTLGLEQTEKAVLFSMITAETWPGLQKDLRRKMRIDVPGTGIAFIIPVSSIGGKRALQFLTEHQTFALKEESTLKDTRYELLLVIANQGHTGSIMDAARAAGAGGGTDRGKAEQLPRRPPGRDVPGPNHPGPCGVGEAVRQEICCSGYDGSTLFTVGGHIYTGSIVQLNMISVN